jgi:hypothetical protein
MNQLYLRWQQCWVLNITLSAGGFVVGKSLESMNFCDPYLKLDAE